MEGVIGLTGGRQSENGFDWHVLGIITVENWWSGLLELNLSFLSDLGLTLVFFLLTTWFIFLGVTWVFELIENYFILEQLIEMDVLSKHMIWLSESENVGNGLGLK